MAAPERAPQWPELDLLRGLAILLMIANHVAVDAVRSAPLVSGAFFLGSFAPVLFFTITGVGYGLRRERRPLTATAWGRLGVLVGCDQLLISMGGFAVGLDFLGFIGIASFLLDRLAGHPRRVEIAAAGIGLILVLRYGLAVAVVDGPPVGWEGTIGAALGIFSIPGLSYPPLPWAVYPLLGFLAGELLARWPDATRQRATWLALAGAGAVALAAALLLARIHGPPSRWGTMSPSFFAATGVFLPAVAALAVALVAHARGPWLEALSLRGVASLAVVPLHYAMLRLSGALLAVPDSAGGYAARFLLVATSSLALAHALAAGARRAAAGGAAARRFWITGSPTLAAAAYLALGARVPEPPLEAALSFAAQLLLCVTLGVLGTRPARAA